VRSLAGAVSGGGNHSCRERSSISFSIVGEAANVYRWRLSPEDGDQLEQTGRRDSTDDQELHAVGRRLAGLQKVGEWATDAGRDISSLLNNVMKAKRS